MTTDELFNNVKTLLRSNVQSNMIEQITKKDLENAFNMTMSKINMSKPITNISKEDMLEDDNMSLWYTIVINGMAYYTITSQITEWMHNGIDVNIEDLSVTDKMDQYITVADRFKEEFYSMLEEVKPLTSKYSNKRTIIKDVNSVTRFGGLNGSRNTFRCMRIGRLK